MQERAIRKQGSKKNMVTLPFNAGRTKRGVKTQTLVGSVRSSRKDQSDSGGFTSVDPECEEHAEVCTTKKHDPKSNVMLFCSEIQFNLIEN